MYRYAVAANSTRLLRDNVDIAHGSKRLGRLQREYHHGQTPAYGSSETAKLKLVTPAWSSVLLNTPFASTP
jgi:hypothetical protein